MTPTDSKMVPSKHPKPSKSLPHSLNPSRMPTPTAAAFPQKPAPSSQTPADPQAPDKHVSNKSPPESRVPKQPTAKADKAAEKAAEQAALTAARASLHKSISQNATQLTATLTDLEATIDKLEQDYIRTTWAHGNVLRGWDGLTKRLDRHDKAPSGNTSGVATGAPKHRKSRPSDRIFSLSSSTSQFRRQNPDVLIQKRSLISKKKKKRP